MASINACAEETALLQPHHRRHHIDFDDEGMQSVDDDIGAHTDGDGEQPKLNERGNVAWTRKVDLLWERVWRDRSIILTLACCWVALQDVSTSIANASLTEVFQDITCRKMYEGSGKPLMFQGSSIDPRCLTIEVQSEVAFIRGWKDTLDQLPGILLALPYGLLANHSGRKTVLFLSTLGMTLRDVAVRIVSLLLIGGGGQVGTAIIFTMVADAFPGKGRVGAFYNLVATELASQTISTMLGAVLMSITPWLPIGVSVVFSLASLLLCLTFPDTVKVLSSPPIEIHARTQRVREQRRLFELANRLHARVCDATADFIKSLEFLSGEVSLMTMMAVFFGASLSMQSMALLLQYISKRYGWSYARASLSLTISSAVNLILVLFLMPYFNKRLIHVRKLPATIKDLRMSQVSCVFLAIGSLALAFSATPAALICSLIVLSLGSTFLVSLRSLAALLVAPENVATLYSLLTIITGTGFLVAGPLHAQLFHWGLSSGKTWLGLPFVFAAAIYGLSGTALFCLKEPYLLDKSTTSTRGTDADLIESEANHEDP